MTDEKYEKVVLRIVYGVIIPIILIAESVITIYINGKSSVIKRRSSKLFVNNLAISGAVIGISFSIFSLLRVSGFPKGNLYCHAEILPYYWTLSYFHLVSVTSLVCLAFDRYLAICWPLRYRQLLTFFRCKVLTISCWLVSFIVLFIPTISTLVYLLSSTEGYLNNITYSLFKNIDYSLGISELLPRECEDQFNKTLTEVTEVTVWLICRKAFTVSYGTTYFLSLFLIVCMYLLVMRECCIVRRRANATTISMKEEDNKARMETTKDLLLVVFLYFTLSMPHVILKLVTIDWSPYTYLKTHQVTIFLAVIHQVLFLPLYAWKFSDFRSKLCSSRIWNPFGWTKPCGSINSDSRGGNHVELMPPSSSINSSQTSSVCKHSQCSIHPV